MDLEFSVAENIHLRDRSGNVRSEDKLVSFLYELMRDHLAAGTVEELVREACYERQQEETIRYTNGFLAKYAQDLAARLRTSP